MKVQITKADLTRVLTIANSIVEKRTTMPILTNVLIIAEPDQGLHVSATNLEITASLTAKAKVSEAGKTTVSAKVFGEIVRELPDGEINLELTEGERLEITCGNSKFRMVLKKLKNY